MESRFISTVSNCQLCGPSMQWLGQTSPVEKIKQSGLWQVNQLYKELLNDKDADRLAVLVNDNSKRLCIVPCGIAKIWDKVS